jgi:hypothetical protein
VFAYSTILPTLFIHLSTFSSPHCNCCQSLLQFDDLCAMLRRCHALDEVALKSRDVRLAFVASQPTVVKDLMLSTQPNTGGHLVRASECFSRCFAFWATTRLRRSDAFILHVSCSVERIGFFEFLEVLIRLAFARHMPFDPKPDHFGQPRPDLTCCNISARVRILLQLVSPTPPAKKSFATSVTHPHLHRSYCIVERC